MITRIEIRNFQAHKKLAIEFDEGCTTIVGASDVGKSSVIRALGLVMFNKPSGTAFIREGAKRCSVKVFLKSGDTIYREKGKENIYKINDKELKAFGNEVPEDTKKLLNINTLNFQGQHDSPYWFCETAGEVSRQLNRIVNLEVIDTTLNNINSVIRRTKSKVDIFEDQLKMIEEDLKNVDHVSDMDKSLKQAEQKELKFSILRADYAEALKYYEKLLSGTNTLKRATEEACAANLTASKGSGLLKYHEDIQALETQMKTIIIQSEIMNEKPNEKKLLSLHNFFRLYEERKAELKNLNRAVLNLAKLEQDKCLLMENSKKANSEWEKLKGKCPLCGKPEK